jgi:hypothetical protein
VDTGVNVTVPASHHVAGAAFPDALAQAKAAVDFVADGESGADAPVAGHQVIEQARVRSMIYAGSGCRVVVVFHKPA